ncbi:SDR family oxidoreductase [Candidatus Woesearchaeota archaeon]|nr:SDR family oxidoreductase [Candidatus Woesearchaeota archaeon]
MGNLFNLKGKTAWITGGKRIGQRVAEVLAERGANIIISYNRSRKEAEHTIKKLKRYNVKTLLIQADVSSRQNAVKAVDEIKKNFNKIDILILMASVFEKTNLMSITEHDFKKNLDVHVQGTFWPIMECLGIMPKGSRIITISDRTSIGITYKEYLPYIVSKAAVAQMTKTLAVELGEKGIFVNSIAPGPVLKPEGMPGKEWQKIRELSAVNYKITDNEAVEEFAKLVLYLSAARSTGAIYPLDLGHL